MKNRKSLKVAYSNTARGGNAIVVIEHNLDVIKNSDWIIDIGPEGGKGGGKIIAEGTKKDIKKSKISHTAKFL